MRYRGHIKDGVVVLEPLAWLPEGAEVRVEVIATEPPAGIDPDLLRKWRGRGRLPHDRSVDDYLNRVRDGHGG